MARQLKTDGDVREHLAPVVLGADILGYTYVRSFHELYGLTSIVLATADVKATSSSRFCDYRIVEGVDTDEVLIAYLEDLGRELAAQGKVGFLVGCGDWYARILSQHKERLSEWYVVPYIDFPLLDDITQKERFYQICEELGIPYPKTWRFDCSDQTAAIDVDAFSYPLIAKPSNSAAYHYAEFPGKRKIFEIYEPQELERVFSALKASSYDRELIVQEFIPGDDDGLRSISIITNEQGDPITTCSGQVVLQDHAPGAIGNPVCIVSERVEEAIDEACRFLKHVGYHGFANFDAKLDPRDGKYKFFEVNTRPGRNSFYVTLGGVNFVKVLVDEFALHLDRSRQDATKPFVYACVPPYVVRRTVHDKALRDRVLALYREGKARFPLYYDEDALVHRFWAWVTYYHQIPKFKKYVWDTGGRQVGEE